MLLKIKNVGRLKPAEVKIDGLTVICGNNNTGKSTIGKIIYCIFTAFYEIDESIAREKKELIIRYLHSQMPEPSVKTLNLLSECVEKLMKTDPASRKEIQLLVDGFIKKVRGEKDYSLLKEIVDKILQIMRVDRDNILYLSYDKGSVCLISILI